ncbi:molybdopterin-guanine dinucleotide biosynthesis protein B [Seleniivibrio woodruffii]|uniref:molybdopterin-guanine dinucleotide biosynthesis protein B n=1 Tax=Seleniivibrio woodruffii TaxID=1078050 RepID=UPI0026F003C1|nr:molybdopterin-guanine dinucleotide biosynthesis protein B [Seleniivibrio woodruffii]
MKPLVSFVGTSGCGKTTLIEKVIPLLTTKGYNVSTVKHDAHDFQMDKEGKDTWRHKKAGARAILISNKEKYAMICDVDKEKSIEELTAMLPDYTDIIIAEGFKKELQKKIEVFRSGYSTKLQCAEDENLIAVATDMPENPQVQGRVLLDLNNPQQIADFIIKNIL